jgi:hypothetical protein
MSRIAEENVMLMRKSVFWTKKINIKEAKIPQSRK